MVHAQELTTDNPNRATRAFVRSLASISGVPNIFLWQFDLVEVSEHLVWKTIWFNPVPGWWFGTWLLFFDIFGMSSSQLTFTPSFFGVGSYTLIPPPVEYCTILYPISAPLMNHWWSRGRWGTSEDGSNWRWAMAAWFCAQLYFGPPRGSFWMVFFDGAGHLIWRRNWC
jgi:hypothetical protein